MKVESNSPCHVRRNREFISIRLFRHRYDERNRLMEQTVNARVRTRQGTSSADSSVRKDLEEESETLNQNYAKPKTMRGDTTMRKNGAADGFACTQQIPPANTVHQNLLRIPTAYGKSLMLTSTSEFCAFFQICATRTSEQRMRILLSKITIPNSN